MSVATPVQTNLAAQSALVDADFQVASRVAWAFAPHEQLAANMSVRVDAGAIFDGTTLAEIAVQNSPTITAPSVNPRIDRIVVDRASGTVSVVSGTEAASPTAPAIPAGKCPIAQVTLAPSSTVITNSMIMDERVLGSLGLGSMATQNANNVNITGGTITGITDLAVADGGTGASSFTQFAVLLGNGTNPIQTVSGLGTAGQVLTSNGAGSAPSWQAPATPIPSGTKMLFAQAAAPTGWTQINTWNDRVIRAVDNGGTGGGTGGSWTISGVSVDSHTLTVSEMPSHNHGIGGVTTASGGDHVHALARGLSGEGSDTAFTLSALRDDIFEPATVSSAMGSTGSHTHTLTGSTANAGSGGGHSHGVTANGAWRPAYLDVIVCAKD